MTESSYTGNTPPEEIFTIDALTEAWETVKAKHSAGGIDEISIKDFTAGASDYLEELRAELINGRYIPEPYKLFYVAKTSGEYRPLALMTIRDKIAQMVVYRYYLPLLDKMFVNTSYAYRPGKGHTKAIGRIADFLNRKYSWVCGLDIDNFFDTINRRLLFEKCARYFGSPVIQKLIEMWVLTGMIYDGKYIEGDKGIAQGGVLSPLLSNLYLHGLDFELMQRGIQNVRYADNIIIMNQNKDGLIENVQFVKNYLTEELKLSLNTKEREIQNAAEGFVFCGIFFYGGQKRIAAEKIDSMKQHITEIVNNEPLTTLESKLIEYKKGLNVYYRPFDTADQINSLEQHLAAQLSRRIAASLKSKELASPRAASQWLRTLSFFNHRPSAEYRSFLRGIISSAIRGESPPVSARATQPGASGSVLRKRAFYTSLLSSEADIIVNANYTQIGKSCNKIILRREGKIKNEVSAHKIRHIIVYGSGITISSDAISLCAQNEITVTYYDGLGNPYANITGFSAPLSSVSRNQVEAANNKTGKIIAQKIIFAKVKNQIALIKFIAKNRKFPKEALERINRGIDDMEKLADNIVKLNHSLDFDELRAKIFGYEGSAAITYWDMFAMLLPSDYEFENREHQGAKGLVNMLLNYAYGILYTRVNTAITFAGLNPNISFLHKEQKGKPTLVFDIIEEFRAPVADRAVIALLSRKPKLTKSGDKLSDETRKKIAKKVLERLHKEIFYRGRRISFNDVMLEQAKEIVKFIDGSSMRFRPFLSKW